MVNMTEFPMMPGLKNIFTHLQQRSDGSLAAAGDFMQRNKQKLRLTLSGEETLKKTNKKNSKLNTTHAPRLIYAPSLMSIY